MMPATKKLQFLTKTYCMKLLYQSFRVRVTHILTTLLSLLRSSSKNSILMKPSSLLTRSKKMLRRISYLRVMPNRSESRLFSMHSRYRLDFINKLISRVSARSTTWMRLSSRTKWLLRWRLKVLLLLNKTITSWIWRAANLMFRDRFRTRQWRWLRELRCLTKLTQTNWMLWSCISKRKKQSNSLTTNLHERQ